MSITKAIISDVPQLNKLVNSAYRGEISKKGWTTESDILDGLRIDEETLTSYFNNPDITILKNTNEAGEITGSVYLEVRQPKLYVGMFSVSPLLQNSGIGRKLLMAAEDYAKQLNLNQLSMTVISTRHELISWYERRGYKATGEILPFHADKKFGIPKQYIELIVMEKSI
ncbi:ribosomal protein S18 acetylase RimI-like enzyme [Mucilaginibacter frigoritolerans]|jgi:ribosomal protein S18 acetylase RimI-like enzyme|uniref:Ribosomal protein S18 acetylase RimI-like enzyme n=1 Tax=Mucilaginibacter frigoritolerans TaxID=652788 RepID=A0A562UGG7_9SPHI|nr:GNAT family N-acetyltransferase [Mucilaginibacter frigoritolerans]TWJ04477.1 ribosomal protein S18 acetylase RimI-like enzyme [Mucilaginibacter frigoritolerans]